MTVRNWKTQGYLKNIVRSFFASIIHFQHRNLTIPIFIWKFIYKYKFSYNFYLIRFYGQECFLADYSDRKRISCKSKANLDYWSSIRSLYWHYWRINDKNESRLLDLFYTFPNIFKGRVLEIGFGIGRYYSFLKKLNSFYEYFALEANYFCVKESSIIYP